MKFFLISDNIDTQMGLRLSGIDGVVAHDEQQIKNALENALKDSEIGIILITEKLSALAADFIYEIKMNHSVPLIVEIPDRHGAGRTKDAITSYIKNAIGLKL